MAALHVPRVAPFRDFAPLPIPAGARVFVLTGAGISAESGIRTFRDANGLWEQYRFEEVASPGGWAADPALVWRFYAERRAQASTCEPNAAHRCPGRPRATARRAPLSLHAERRRPAREGGPQATRAHARRAHEEPMRVVPQAPVRRRDRPHPTARTALRLRRARATAHRVVRRDALRDGAHRARARRVRPLRDDRQQRRRVPGRRIRQRRSRARRVAVAPP